MMSALPQAIAEYTLHEKIQLVEDIWDNIAQEAATAHTTSEAAQAEIMRRIAWSEANPGHSSSLGEIATRLGVCL
jgi:putative addiction module component (TIGR02574 family)